MNILLLFGPRLKIILSPAFLLPILLYLSITEFKSTFDSISCSVKSSNNESKCYLPIVMYLFFTVVNFEKNTYSSLQA